MAYLEHGVGARRFEVFRLEAARRRRAVSTSGGPLCRKGSSKGAAELAAGGLKKSEAARTTRARFRAGSSMRSWRRPRSRLTSKSGLRRRPGSPGHAVGKRRGSLGSCWTRPLPPRACRVTVVFDRHAAQLQRVPTERPQGQGP